MGRGARRQGHSAPGPLCGWVVSRAHALRGAGVGGGGGGRGVAGFDHQHKKKKHNERERNWPRREQRTLRCRPCFLLFHPPAGKPGQSQPGTGSDRGCIHEGPKSSEGKPGVPLLPLALSPRSAACHLLDCLQMEGTSYSTSRPHGNPGGRRSS